MRTTNDGLMRKLFAPLLRTFAKMYASNTTPRYFKNTFAELHRDRLVIPETNIKSAIDTILVNINKSFKPIEENGLYGLYLGTAGVSYMYYQLSKRFRDKAKEYLKNAVTYLRPALRNVDGDNSEPGLILGSDGVYALAAVIYHAINDREKYNKYLNKYYDSAKLHKDVNCLGDGADELFVGRAGYLAGALWLARETDSELKTQDVYDICKIIIVSGREYAKKVNSQSPLMYYYHEVEYLGAAHGLCSILQMLLNVPGYLDSNPDDAKDVKSTVDHLLTLQDDDGNFPPTLDESDERHNELVHWCHGAPGIIYLMATAYKIWGDNKYFDCCVKCAELVWNRGLLKKGPGLCHGVAGNGYVFLLMFRLTDDPKYLQRAIAFGQFMQSDNFKQQARVPDNPYSLYEGIAGTACFLGDLIQPDKAEFPFTDVY